MGDSPASEPFTVPVFVRRHSDAYIARCGSGKAARSCSCTSNARFAVQRAAAKFLQCPEDDRIQLTQVNEALWHATLLPSIGSDLVEIEWIAIAREMPDDETTVLTAVAGDPDSISLGFHSNGRWQHISDEEQPTHWADLPLPPVSPRPR